MPPENKKMSKRNQIDSFSLRYSDYAGHQGKLSVKNGIIILVSIHLRLSNICIICFQTSYLASENDYISVLKNHHALWHCTFVYCRLSK